MCSMHIHNPSTKKAEAGGCLDPLWATASPLFQKGEGADRLTDKLRISKVSSNLKREPAHNSG